ncbi:MAG: branched-chain amino acid ABC transporter ATP-binding protein/permease [Deltaproteobacteria bacterium]|nr:branched-chain amino acid ABC transporter ATP-binding protein/permease [Deltaproteobacteria bacterium]
MDYIFNVLVFILIYAVWVQSLNLIMGYVGVISMGHAIFSGIGAYTAALISVHLGYNFLVGTVAGFLLATVVGALLAIPSLRVRNEYLIVFTVGFQMVAYEFMITARGITEGQGGIPNIPSPQLFGFAFNTPFKFLPLALVTTVICFAIVWRLVNSPFGRVLKAIREDESACRALGKNTLKFKVLVFALGGGIAAIAGSTMAYFITFISPVSFSIEISIFIIVMVVLGGEASFWGPLVGAAILVGLPEVLRFLPGTAGFVDVLREIFYGLILMFMMIFRPQGILPEYAAKTKPVQGFQDLPDEADAFSAAEERNTASAEEKGSSPQALEITGLSKSFGGLQAVKDASLRLASGKITGLIGPNGCGKTTVFNLITGFLPADDGKVYVHGKEITGKAPYKLVDDGLVRSWQDIRIFKDMTVLDNVLVARPKQSGEEILRLFFSPWRVARQERENARHAFGYLKMVDLIDKAGHLAGSLSTAEQKLVALARLMATECKVLLLDEPTAALDLESVERIIKLIKGIAKQGRKTILLIEHNLDVVRGLVEEAYFMSEGRVLAHGEPSALMADPKLAEVYFGVD